jgi:hypothetical protein
MVQKLDHSVERPADELPMHAELAKDYAQENGKQAVLRPTLVGPFRWKNKGKNNETIRFKYIIKNSNGFEYISQTS